MTRNIQLRQGSADHYPFALELYLSTMRPYTEELMVWDEQKQRDNFAAQWKPGEVQIVALDGNCVGWLQVSETPTEIRLQQFFISPGHQRAGIGTEVLNSLVGIWSATGKPFVLTVLKNNPARRLYERFGFSVFGEVGVKFEMKRQMSAQDLDEKVILCPHDPLWFSEASKLASHIAKNLCDLDAKVEHVGSTAVPGLEAKPIIDLLVGLADEKGIDEAAKRLSEFGWQDLGEAGVAGRRYMRTRGAAAVNLHIVLVDQEHWVNNLALRDYLRSYPIEADEYAAAKRAALAAGHTRLLSYSAAKAKQIAVLLSKATAWSQGRK